MFLKLYRRLLSTEWRGYIEYAAKMVTITAFGVCLCFLFASLLLLGVDMSPPLPNEAALVTDEVRHAWRQYRRHSWGANELAPETLSPSGALDSLVGPQSGLTIVESLGLLHLMQLSKEFQQAEAWVASSFNFTNVTSRVSVGHVSSRLLGGLLSAFSLTEKPMFLYKALQVAEGLLVAFDTPSELPAPRVLPLHGPAGSNRRVSTVELSQLYLEFAFLHRLTGLGKFGAAQRKLLAPLLKHLLMRRPSGSLNATAQLPWTPPNIWDTWTGEPAPAQAPENENHSGHLASLLALAEVSIKAHLLVGDPDARTIFEALMRDRLTMNSWLDCRPSSAAECAFSLTTCRLVETLLLSLGQSRDPIVQRDLAYKVAELCGSSAKLNPLRLTPDGLLLRTTSSGLLVAREADGHYAGQPEPVLASLLVWSRRRRLSNRQFLSDTLQAMMQHLKSPAGYQGFTRPPTANGAGGSSWVDNRQPSYLMAQTFKYIYMAFEPNQLNLVSSDWLFNTAGHLLPVGNGRRFQRLRTVVKANWAEVRRILGDLERRKIARRRGQVAVALGAASPAGHLLAVLLASAVSMVTSSRGLLL